jgi:hypothetical protein
MNAQRIFFQKNLMDEQEELIKELKKWGQTKGLSGTDLYKPLLTSKKDLITPYSKEYYDLINDVKHRSNVSIIGYTPFENYYANNIKNVYILKLIKYKIFYSILLFLKP